MPVHGHSPPRTTTLLTSNIYFWNSWLPSMVSFVQHYVCAFIHMIVLFAHFHLIFHCMTLNILFIYSTINGHLESFQFETCINSVAMNILKHVP